ncbi:MAG: hypothetical protein VXW65_10060, partial [Pseudomonadota bacterium]|nr:hypothetical protein [Pseudomonadota bacterium]
MSLNLYLRYVHFTLEELLSGYPQGIFTAIMTDGFQKRKTTRLPLSWLYEYLKKDCDEDDIELIDRLLLKIQHMIRQQTLIEGIDLDISDQHISLDISPQSLEQFALYRTALRPWEQNPHLAQGWYSVGVWRFVFPILDSLAFDDAEQPLAAAARYKTALLLQILRRSHHHPETVTTELFELLSQMVFRIWQGGHRSFYKDLNSDGLEQELLEHPHRYPSLTQLLLRGEWSWREWHNSIPQNSLFGKHPYGDGRGKIEFRLHDAAADFLLILRIYRAVQQADLQQQIGLDVLTRSTLPYIHQSLMRELLEWRLAEPESSRVLFDQQWCALIQQSVSTLAPEKSLKLWYLAYKERIGFIPAHNANWSRLRLDWLSLTDCDLSGVNLSGSTIQHGEWRQINLQGANLTGSKWMRQRLVDCQLTDCTGLPQVIEDCTFENCTLDAAFLNILRASPCNQVKHVDPQQCIAGQPRPILLTKKTICHAMLSPDATTLVYCDDQRHMYMYDLVTYQRRCLERMASVRVWLFHPDSAQIIWLDENGCVWLRDLNKPRKERLKRAQSKNKSIAISPDGQTLALIRPNAIRIFNLSTKRAVDHIRPDRYGGLQTLAFHHTDSNQLLLGGDGLWHLSLDSKKMRTILTASEFYIDYLGFLQGSNAFFAGHDQFSILDLDNPDSREYINHRSADETTALLQPDRSAFVIDY